MAKQKKKHKKNSTSSVSSTPAGEVKAQLKRFNWKRALIIAASTAVAYTVYLLLLNVPFLRIHGIPVIMPVYIVAVTVLAAFVVMFNSGFSSKPITADMLKKDDFTDEAELEQTVIKLNERKKTARFLMLFLIPLVFSLFFDMIVLFYGDFVKGAFNTLFGG